MRIDALKFFSLITEEQKSTGDVGDAEDDARDRVRDEVPGRHELHPPRPRREEHPGRPEPRLQGLRLRVEQDHRQRPQRHLHDSSK